MSAEATSILNDDDQQWVPVPLPESEGVFFKVLKVDVENRRVIAKVRFSPGSRMPRHNHFCRAVAYTVSGSWEYDEGKFEAGHTAFEMPGALHTPWSDEGAELFLVFDCDQDIFLENFLSCGTKVTLGIDLLKAFEKVTPEQAAQVDVHSMVEVTPPTGN